MRPPSRLTDPAAEAFRERLGSAVWRIIHSGAGGAAWNMALDASMLQAAACKAAPPTLRFYGWNPTAVSLGRFQSPAGIDTAYARERGWDLVRRPTGGRAVLHQHELTYSLVLPPSVLGSTGVRTSYQVLVGALNAGLAHLLEGHLQESGSTPASGCEARTSREPNCFALASECDSVTPGGKLVGSAQVRRDGALLQHGSLLLDAEPEAWTALFGSPGRLVTLQDLLASAPSPDQAADALIQGFRGLGIRTEFGRPSAEELEAAHRQTADFLL